MTTTNDHTSRLGTHPKPTLPRSATDWSVAALCKLLEGVSNWTRLWHRERRASLDVRLSADPELRSCIIGVQGAVDDTNARELTRALQTVRGYRFVSIDLSAATFEHPLAQLRFDQASEQLEFAGTTVAVSGARDNMGVKN